MDNDSSALLGSAPAKDKTSKTRRRRWVWLVLAAVPLSLAGAAILPEGHQSATKPAMVIENRRVSTAIAELLGAPTFECYASELNVPSSHPLNLGSVDFVSP